MTSDGPSLESRDAEKSSVFLYFQVTFLHLHVNVLPVESGGLLLGRRLAPGRTEKCGTHIHFPLDIMVPSWLTKPITSDGDQRDLSLGPLKYQCHKQFPCSVLC